MPMAVPLDRQLSILLFGDALPTPAPIIDLVRVLCRPLPILLRLVSATLVLGAGLHAPKAINSLAHLLFDEKTASPGSVSSLDDMDRSGKTVDSETDAGVSDEEMVSSLLCSAANDGEGGMLNDQESLAYTSDHTESSRESASALHQQAYLMLDSESIIAKTQQARSSHEGQTTGAPDRAGSLLTQEMLASSTIPDKLQAHQMNITANTSLEHHVTQDTRISAAVLELDGSTSQDESFEAHAEETMADVSCLEESGRRRSAALGMLVVSSADTWLHSTHADADAQPTRSEAHSSDAVSQKNHSESRVSGGAFEKEEVVESQRQDFEGTPYSPVLSPGSPASDVELPERSLAPDSPGSLEVLYSPNSPNFEESDMSYEGDIMDTHEASAFLPSFSTFSRVVGRREAVYASNKARAIKLIRDSAQWRMSELQQEIEEAQAEMESAVCKTFLCFNPQYYTSSAAGLVELDLHLLSYEDALKFVECHLNACRKEGVESTRIITGRGLHSKGGEPVLKPRIFEYLETQEDLTVMPYNEGSFTVYFTQD